VGKPNETVVKLLKIHDGKGWRYSELTGPENRCYLLEKIIGTRDTVKEVMEEGLRVMNGINEGLVKADKLIYPYDRKMHIREMCVHLACWGVDKHHYLLRESIARSSSAVRKPSYFSPLIMRAGIL
jgi:hypothetical protein